VSDIKKCTECNSKTIIVDNKNGEIVCKTCGLVIDNIEFAPPEDRIPKTEPNHTIAYTNNSVGIEMDPSHRIELNIAHDINRIIQKLELPHNLEPLAINYVRKLRRLMKQQKEHKTRLTKTELTVVSIWTTIKLTNYPLSADEYLKKLQTLLTVKNLMKIEKRAGQFIKNEPRIPDTTLVTGHINRITAKLEDTHLIDSTYANTICGYAIQIIQANPGIITSRKANLVAASALLGADWLLTNQLALKPLAQAANTGTGRLSELAQTCKHYAPTLPKDWAAIKFNHYLFKE
jgi:transcription initiation factor TFIIIB Brf1 subunit/transcription initiation factor TFIIB